MRNYMTPIIQFNKKMDWSIYSFEPYICKMFEGNRKNKKKVTFYLARITIYNTFIL